MAYDSRSVTGIPTEPVGSLPRPAKLQAAYAAYDAGEIGFEQLEAEQEEAVRDSITRMEATGSPIVSDGEQRWSSFATYAITDTLAGTGLADHLDGRRAVLRDLLRWSQPPATRAHERAVPLQDLRGRHAGQVDQVRQQADEAGGDRAVDAVAAVPARGRGAGLLARASSRKTWSNECEKDIRQAFDAGAARVSIDFTEGRLATRADPRNPWTGAGMLPHFIDLNNRVLDRFTPEERANIGIHTCPGGDRDAVHSADVPYSDLLPSLFKMNAGYFLIQFASERDKEPVLKMIGEHSREDANGVAQVCYIGVTNPQNPRVETAAGGLRPARGRRQTHPYGAARGDRRLRLLSLLDRREAVARLTRLRSRHRVPEDREPRAGGARWRPRSWGSGYRQPPSADQAWAGPGSRPAPSGWSRRPVSVPSTPVGASRQMPGLPL